MAWWKKKTPLLRKCLWGNRAWENRYIRETAVVLLAWIPGKAGSANKLNNMLPLVVQAREQQSTGQQLEAWGGPAVPAAAAGPGRFGEPSELREAWTCFCFVAIVSARKALFHLHGWKRGTGEGFNLGLVLVVLVCCLVFLPRLSLPMEWNGNLPHYPSIGTPHWS